MKSVSKIHFVIFLLILSPLRGWASIEISLSFDDAPRSSSYLNGTDRASKIVSALKEEGVRTVAFFSNSQNLDKEGTERMKYYGNKGHFIGNHTHSHPNLNESSIKDYIDNIVTGDRLLSEIQGFKKYFRFPYLREGNTIEKRDGIRKKLNNLGYLNAYITVNNYDWYMDSLFQKARKAGKKINFSNLKKVYVNVLIESIRYYDNLAKKHLGRSPKHVLLLHENDLAALYISDLVREIKKKGWKIISPEESYNDPIASYLTNRVLAYNPGRIGEYAFDHGELRKNLWHEACDEKYLENLFIASKVY